MPIVKDGYQYSNKSRPRRHISKAFARGDVQSYSTITKDGQVIHGLIERTDGTKGIPLSKDPTYWEGCITGKKGPEVPSKRGKKRRYGGLNTKPEPREFKHPQAKPYEQVCRQIDKITRAHFVRLGNWSRAVHRTTMSAVYTKALDKCHAGGKNLCFEWRAGVPFAVIQ